MLLEESSEAESETSDDGEPVSEFRCRRLIAGCHLVQKEIGNHCINVSRLLSICIHSAASY